MTNHDEETRSVYQKQHERISDDKSAFSRIAGMYDNYAMGLNREWFKNKRAIDVGCGNIGAMMIRLLQLDVSECHGVDIGTDWIESLEKNIQKAVGDTSKVQLKTGSVTQIPYPDNSFDFVSVNGVLIHLEDMIAVEDGFMDAARVVSTQGALYTSYGPCGGVMQGVIFPALRDYYRKNNEFREADSSTKCNFD